MRISQFAIEGLGHLSTLIADESAGVAAVVDPRRDVDIYLDAARAARPPDHPRRRDAPPQRLRLGRAGPRRADRRDARHRGGCGARLRAPARSATARRSTSASSGSRLWTRPATPRSTSPTRSPTRSRADEPLLLFTGGSLLVGAVGRTDLLGAEQRAAVRPGRCTARSTRSSCPRGLRRRLPDPRRRVALLDRHRVDAVLDDRLRAPPQPDAPAPRTSTRSPAPPPRPAGVPALLRPDAADEPGRAAAPRRARAGAAAAGRRRGRGRRIAGGALLVDLRLAGGPRGRATSRARCRSRRARRSERGWAGSSSRTGRSSSSSSDRPTGTTRSARRSGSAHEGVVGPPPRRLRRAGPRAAAPIEAGGRLTVDQLAARLDRGGPAAPLVIDVRQASEYASRPRSRAAPHHRRLAAGPTRRAARATGPSRRSARPGSGRASRPRSSGRPGSRDVSWVASGVPAWRAAGHAVEHGAPPDAAVTTTDAASVAADGHGHPHATPAQPPADEPAAARRR